MEFTTRAFSAPDLPDCLAIEQAAVRSNHYLADVLDYYTTTRGEFTVVCADGKPVGIGKLTVLYDNSAWLELLRVHPQYQRQGRHRQADGAVRQQRLAGAAAGASAVPAAGCRYCHLPPLF